MSPEQILGDKLDARSDIFSLGIVLYQMVTGRKPFVEDEQRSVMHKIRLEKHVKARKLNPEIPRELDRIIDKCLAKTPRDRWRSAQQMVMALERFLAKHVEMNYHARLVLFLRGQSVVTQLEADEYLNPALGGPGAGALVQPNIQARQAVRRGMVVHASILGVLALMLGLIHVAPVGDSNSVSPTILEASKRGFVRVIAYPWAHVTVDGHDAGVTPLDQPLELAEGKHRVTLAHDWYQPIERTIEVSAGERDDAGELRVDFEADGTLKPGKSRPEPDDEPSLDPVPTPTIADPVLPSDPAEEPETPDAGVAVDPAPPPARERPAPRPVRRTKVTPPR
jgi:serine/threonine-protein kinase